MKRTLINRVTLKPTLKATARMSFRDNFYSLLLSAIFFVPLLWSQADVQAQEIKGQQVCDKIKTCVFDSLGDQANSEQVRAMVTAQLDKQCAGSFSGKHEELREAGLVDKANACSDAIVAMPCSELMVPNGVESDKACMELKEATEKAGIELK